MPVADSTISNNTDYKQNLKTLTLRAHLIFSTSTAYKIILRLSICTILPFFSKLCQGKKNKKKQNKTVEY